MGKTILLKLIFAWTLCAVSVCLSTIKRDDIPCDLDSDNITCPDGYCCARNHSDFTDAFCQPRGQEGSTCPTYKSRYICPCSDKFFCQQTSNSSALGTCKSKIVDIPCDINSRNKTCPIGMCCVRDEFLFTYTHCKAYGEEGSNCVTHASFYECPCKDGFVCSSNVQGSHVSSLFGSCKAIATVPPTTDTSNKETTTTMVETTTTNEGTATTNEGTTTTNEVTTTTSEGTTTTSSLYNSTTADKQKKFTGQAMVG